MDVPERVSKFSGKRGYVPVKGTLNGFPIRATLVPAGGGCHRLCINGEMRKGAGVDVGDTVNLVLELDTEPRKFPLPLELGEALRKTKSARTAWEGLTPTHRKEILTYLNWLKTAEARKRNVEKIITDLLKKKDT